MHIRITYCLFRCFDLSTPKQVEICVQWCVSGRRKSGDELAGLQEINTRLLVQVKDVAAHWPTQLQKINFVGCPITDVAPLAGCM